MTSRERVFSTFQGTPTDKVPVAHIGFTGKAASHILSREAFVGGGIQRWRESVALWNGPQAHQEFLERSLNDAYELCKATGQDLLRWGYWRLGDKPVERIDEFTFKYGDPDGAWWLRHYDPQTEIFEIVEDRRPPAEVPRDMDELERHVRQIQEQPVNEDAYSTTIAEASRLMERFGGEYALRFGGGQLVIPFDQPIWLEAVAARPDLVADYLDRQVSRRRPVLRALADAGVKLAFGGGDCASPAGPMYSPKAFGELMLPRLKQLTDLCHRLGMHYLFGSDGNLWPIAADLFGLSGVDGYYEVDRRAGMDLNRLRDEYPDLTMVGANMSSLTLDQGTVQDVIAETRDCIETARARGRIVVGVSNAPMPSTPPENLHAMIDTIAECR
ncbi:MAG TPA: uroporphyrinogen decarboxylase family protein [Phycisphaerae bacterium]|nr:uroporphyrinogen decarboxylase family protein [Phycisphaerae bacterium]